MSSISPVSPSITIVSPMRIGWVIDSWMPATTPASDFCAAKPNTTPSKPAEASSESPTLRTSWNCMRTTAAATTTMITLPTRSMTVSWVSTPRASSAAPSEGRRLRIHATATDTMAESSHARPITSTGKVMRSTMCCMAGVKCRESSRNERTSSARMRRAGPRAASARWSSHGLLVQRTTRLTTKCRPVPSR